MTRYNSFRLGFLTLFISFTLLTVFFIAIEVSSYHKNTERLALNIARSSYMNDLALRRWATMHGGVYVPVTEKTPANKYLKHVKYRDITLPDGRQLTLMNPAYILRQVSGYIGLHGSESNITSLRVLNPVNTPDEWERSALKQISKDSDEYYEMLHGSSEKDSVFKYMKGMITEDGCLKCHGFQGYKTGDIRGGISITVPMSRIFDTFRSESQQYITSVVLFWVAATVITIFAYRRISRLSLSEQKALEELAGANQKLSDLNATLSKKIDEETKKRTIQQKMLMQESKLARLGEIMGSIAHQWRQPLNSLSVLNECIRDELNEMDDKKATEIRDMNEELQMVIEHMNSTMLDFQNFYKKDRKLERFDAVEAIHKTLAIVKKQLYASNIHTTFHCECPKKNKGCSAGVEECSHGQAVIYGAKGEFGQVILNIISNSERAIREARDKGFDAGTISIALKCSQEEIFISFQDDGVGINEAIIDKIFDPFYTTDAVSGTGSGLYMSRIIIRDHMNGRISASNTENGAEIKISLPLMDAT